MSNIWVVLLLSYILLEGGCDGIDENDDFATLNLIKRSVLDGNALTSTIPSHGSPLAGTNLIKKALKNAKNVLKKTKSINSHLGFRSLGVITRDEWEARPIKLSQPFLKPASKIIIHHTASHGCLNMTTCVALIQAIQKYRMDVQGMSSIGYNFIIGGDGRIYEGLGWKKYTNVTGSIHDLTSLHVAFLGDFSKSKPNDAQMRAFTKFEDYGDKKDYVKSYRIHGHRDIACTACPGDALFALVKAMTRYRTIPGPNCQNITMTTSNCI